MQLYFIHKESVPTHCTILLICSYISNMFRSDLLAIFSEWWYAVVYQRKAYLTHVVTTVVVFTIIKIIKMGL